MTRYIVKTKDAGYSCAHILGDDDRPICGCHPQMQHWEIVEEVPPRRFLCLGCQRAKKASQTRAEKYAERQAAADRTAKAAAAKLAAWERGEPRG